MIWYLNGTFPMKQPRGVINPGLTLQALWSFSWGAVVPVYSQSSDSLYACQVFLGHWVCWKNHHVISCLYRGLQTGKEKEPASFEEKWLKCVEIGFVMTWPCTKLAQLPTFSILDRAMTQTEASVRNDLAAVYRICHKLGLNEGVLFVH